MWRSWLTVVLATALMVGALAPALLSAQEEVVVSLEGPDAVEPGETFIVRVKVDQVTNLDVAGFRVVFDPAVLTVADIGPGADITDGDIEGVAIPVVGANEVSPGTVYVLVNVPGTPGVTGSGYLAEFRFQAAGNEGAQSAIGLTGLLLGDNTALEIPARFAGPVTVTVGVPEAATPTPEPAATPTPAATATPTPEPTATPIPEPTATRVPTATPAPSTATPAPTPATAPPAGTAPPTAAPEPTPLPESGGACGAPAGTPTAGAAAANMLLLMAPLAMIGGLKWRNRRKPEDSDGDG